jgi:hypothetical protein
LIDQSDFENHFSVGDVIQSGGNPDHKNAARLEILEIDNKRVRFRPLRKKTKQSIPYEYLQLLIDRLEDVNPLSIEKSVNVIRKKAHFKKDTTTEVYAYGFAKAYCERTASGTSTKQIDGAIDLFPATRQGFNLSPAIRKAVEDHAMRLARRHFKSKGFTVVTRGKPFDLLCTRTRERLYVEVKGTQGSGAEILLTRGEVKFHRDNPGKMALYIVAEIQVSANGTAQGGKTTIKQPWSLNEESLKPYAFTYCV